MIVTQNTLWKPCLGEFPPTRSQTGISRIVSYLFVLHPASTILVEAGHQQKGQRRVLGFQSWSWLVNTKPDMNL